MSPGAATVDDPHCRVAPSAWVERFAGLVPSGGRVLDVACGSGRHARLFLARGHPVTAVDLDTGGVRDLAGDARVELVQADLEAGGWPLGARRFAGVVVVDYLWRPLLPRLVAAVGPAGVLVYETFAAGNERFGRPRNPDFLLRPGELLEAVAGALTPVAYEHGRTGSRAVRQRLCAVRGEAVLPDP